MSNFAKLEFAAFDISCKNHLSWVLNVEIHLDTKDLKNTIIQGTKASNKIKLKL